MNNEVTLKTENEVTGHLNLIIGGRNITNLRFADGIDAPAEEEQQLGALVECLDKTCTRYKMEVSAEKTN